MKKEILLAVAAIGGVTGSAHADRVCAPSSPIGFYACASITVSWAPNAVIVDVRNFDSWDATLSQVVGGYRLLGFGISGDPSLSSYLNGTVSVSTNGAVGGSTDAPGTYWQYATSFGGNINVEAGAQVANEGWLEGCVSTGAGGKERYVTCDPTYDGSLRFTFGTTNYTLAQFQGTDWSYGIRGNAGPNGVSFKCEDGPGGVADCITTTTTTETVPEPITMILLGTGLAGIGGAARRRRRAQQ